VPAEVDVTDRKDTGGSWTTAFLSSAAPAPVTRGEAAGSRPDRAAEARSSELVIHGDLDHARGSISHPGSVRVHGNVEPDISIHAAGSIHVDGDVRGAQLIAGGAIRVRGHVGGPGRSRLDSLEDIEVGGGRLAEIAAGGTVRCERALVQCSVQAMGRVLLDGELAHLSGGEIHAVRGLRATRIGSSLGRPTVVFIGEAVEVEEAASILVRLKMCVESAARVARRLDEACARIDSLSEGRAAALEGIRRLVMERARTLRLQSSLVRRRRRAGESPANEPPIVEFVEVLPGVTLDRGRGPGPVAPCAGGRLGA